MGKEKNHELITSITADRNLPVEDKQSREVPLYLFHQGTARKAYEFLGAHRHTEQDRQGYMFRVWAPRAKNVFLSGDFNDWEDNCPMTKISQNGVWEVFIGGITEFTTYKYLIEGEDGNKTYKADPYGFHAETRPQTASKTYDLDGYVWGDEAWRTGKSNRNPYESPMNIYEVHIGSWRRYADGNSFSYRKLAEELVPYVKEMGYTHVEFMPVSEYPYDGSWGYQVMGYFSATSRYGTPKDLMYLIDTCHKEGIGVILDWVPGHFPKDKAGLYKFDGSCCYEYEDSLKSEHKSWGTMIFDYGKNEVRSFLISNAIFWFDKFHVDGLRVDAVASMLYLDYGRDDGQWRPNCNGGKENLEAVEFLRELNKAIFSEFPQALMIAEESTAWPMVTMPVDIGGLGFNFKWNMGWMNDTLTYMGQDPFFRNGCHNCMTFPMTYTFSENYILPLSHDEVVHMKGSLFNKMPGMQEQKFHNLRAYMGYMTAHPGKKLLFMGGELAQQAEWDYEGQLQWCLLEENPNKKFQDYIKTLNQIYINYSQLWELDTSWEGFKWIDPDNNEENLLTFRRFNRAGDEILIICNFSSNNYHKRKIPAEKGAKYRLLISGSEAKYGGEGFLQQIAYAEKKNKSDAYEAEFDIGSFSTSMWVRE